ncbi:MAG: 4-hydroxy-tetrahydrodipicolinate reductase [Alphaproteobacteria bacterium]|nr:4-hydroxy-tetrahydrodipicolinate reductase [Alphaproteobacteria bacterium]
MTDIQLKASIAGASGRLGRAIAAELIRRSDTALTGAMVGADSVHLGADIGELAGLPWCGVTAVVSLEEACAGSDVLIDASAPHVTAAIATRLAETGGTAFVTGVTGLSEDQQAAVQAAASAIPVLQASNFSLGVAVLERLVAEAARALADTEFDLEISETHHRGKADSPSGTALSLGRAAAAARGVALDDVAAFERPRTGARRPVGEIGFSAVRGGGVVGEHEARFLSRFEELTVSHRAFDRHIFARGAVEAALWIKGKPAGLYTMQDVIG